MAHPVVHFEIMGGNDKQTEEFYSDLFDWDINSNNEYNYGMVDTLTDEGIKGGVGPIGQGERRVTVYVQVPDINSTLEHAKKLGAEVVLEREDIGAVVLAMFRDPSGNITGLIESPANT